MSKRGARLSPTIMQVNDILVSDFIHTIINQFCTDNVPDATEVILISVNRDTGHVDLCWGGSLDVLHILGALESAKHKILHNGEDTTCLS